MPYVSDEINSDLQKLAVGNIVTLFELNFSLISGDPTDILYFTESIDNDYTPIVWQTVQYQPIHMKTEGWQVTGAESLRL